VPHRLRAIVEDDEVTDEVAAGHRRYARFHDVFDALTWLIVRDPECQESRLIFAGAHGWRRIIKSPPRPYPGYCVILLAYTFTDATVTLHHMKVDPC
jgi:hypothetical protein